jgi:hypothetical protein
MSESIVGMKFIAYCYILIAACCRLYPWQLVFWYQRAAKIWSGLKFFLRSAHEMPSLWSSQ